MLLLRGNSEDRGCDTGMRGLLQSSEQSPLPQVAKGSLTFFLLPG